MDIEGRKLTSFEVATDGLHFRLHFTDAQGQSSAVTLPSECLNELLMTLPRIASRALQARYKDKSLRLVFPALEWRLESSTESRVILTIGTGGGFEASFAFEPRQLCDIANTVSDDAADASWRRILN